MIRRWRVLECLPVQFHHLIYNLLQRKMTNEEAQNNVSVCKGEVSEELIECNKDFSVLYKLQSFRQRTEY